MNIILLEKGEDFLPSSDRRAEHILKVLRLKEEDTLKVGEVNGRRGTAEIICIKENGIRLRTEFSGEREGPSPLTLIVAQVRPISMKRILRDSAQLGVRKLILPATTLGEKSYGEASLYRDGEYRRFLLDGAMQSGHTSLPDVVFPKSLEEAVESSEGDLILLDREGEKGLWEEDLKGKSATLSIGPERGWAGEERRFFLERGFRMATLGERILRTETAVIFSSALALEALGVLDERR